MQRLFPGPGLIGAKVIGALAIVAALGSPATLAADPGADIVANGNGHGAPACNSCHGTNGEGQPDNAIPRLAGLNATYIVHELDGFADGTRKNEIMQPIATALDPTERKAVAAYFADIKDTAKAPTSATAAPASDVASGEAIARSGLWAQGAPACSQCHGRAGLGVGTSFPALAGQSANYTEAQLTDWKSGSRSNDPLGLMAGIASKLSDDQIKAVAAYYASLPPTGAPIEAASIAQEQTK